MMWNGIFRVPQPKNEPILSYAPGSAERTELKSTLKEMLGSEVEVPMIIGGEEVRNGNLADIRCPHDHQHLLGRYHQADASYVTKAVDAAEKTKKEWGEMPWESRAVVLLKAAELLAGKYRQTLNAATMLNMSKEPKSKLMVEEIFGPVLTLYVYPEKDYDEMLEVCDQTSPYALTGSIFALERGAIVKAMNTLRHAAGNFYVNDKPTGAVVAQQPFGGTRASGTNDKAGSWLNLERWVSPRAIKETFLPPRDFRYPYMAKK